MRNYSFVDLFLENAEAILSLKIKIESNIIITIAAATV
jgi:hypothetical protein